MLIENQVVKVNSKSKTAKHYKELGYVPDEEGWFHVKVEHLTKGSHAKVLKKCDYCGEILEVSYKDYLRNHDETLGDSCHKCENNKYIKTMQERYGVNNSTEIPNFESKRKRTMLQRYGVEYTTQSKELREKGKNTMKERYGVEHALQNEEFKEKAMTTRNANKCYASRPQKKLSHKLLDIYRNCVCEVVCKGYSLDCVVEINETKINFEYDGWYWHKDRVEEDNERDSVVIKEGYKVIRVKGNKSNSIPTENKIKEAVNQILNGSCLVIIDTNIK